MDKLKTIKGAIFDLDGTLLDSLKAWPEIDYKFLAKRGISLPPDYPHAIKHMHFYEAAHYTIARFSLDENADDVVREWTDMVKEYYANDVTLKPFAREYLEALLARGVKIAIATSSRRELFLPALKRLNIEPYFHAVVTAEDVGRGKNSPDIYLEAARRLGVSPTECAVFEDVPVAAHTAHGAGFYTVAIFDEASAHEEAALREHSDLYIRSFSELL